MSLRQIDNESLATEICQRRNWNGVPIECGDFLAIADGQLVGVGKTYEEADDCLNAAGVLVGEGLICQVAEPEVEIIRRNFVHGIN